jgi:ABC-2 type transport system ATP-binding protein
VISRIEVFGVSKRYGDKLALDDLSFVVRPGLVTGFLGPNGAGKSTTMRLILGLDRPTAGTARINAMASRDLDSPLYEVGAMPRPAPCIRAAARRATFWRSPRPTASVAGASMR